MVRTGLTSAYAQLGIGIFVLAAADARLAGAQPQDAPRLELKSPFAGTSHALDGDASGNFLVTSGSARILTIWSRYSETQWEPRVIHAPSRDEFAAGKYLAAITPDASYVAFAVPPLSDGRGGYKTETARIYMIERASQQLVTILSPGIPTPVTRLRFSDDGNHLAAVLAHGCGVRIWTRKQWTRSDRNQPPMWSDDIGYADEDGVSKCCSGPDSSGCEHLPSGTDVAFTGLSDRGAPWLLTLSDNGLRTYTRSEQTFRRVGPSVRAAEMALERPGKLAVSPDGGQIAVGDVWAPQLAILDREGSVYRPAGPPKKVGETMLSEEGRKQALLANPVWVQSGGRLLLYAFGYLPGSVFRGGSPDSRANRIAVFDRESEAVSFIPLDDDIDTSLYAFQPPKEATERIFFVSTHRLSMIDTGPEPVQASQPLVIARRAAIDPRGNDFSKWRLMLNNDRKRMYLSTASGEHASTTIELDLGNMRIAALRSHQTSEELDADIAAHGAGEGYYDAEAMPDEWRFNERIDEEPLPSFFGKRIPIASLNRNETSYSGAKVPNKEAIIWGTSRALRIMGPEGNIACTRPINSPAFRMNIAADGRLVVVAHGDGALRWYRLGEGSECLPLVASLYMTRNADGSWGFLAWLPDGKFMTDGGAATKDIACYPLAIVDELAPCIDFQHTDMFYSPADVIRTLNSAQSTEKTVATAPLRKVLAAKQQEIVVQEKPASIDLDSELKASQPRFPIGIMVAVLTDTSRYLTLTAGAGVDLPFTRDGITYSASRPLELTAPGTLDVVAILPESVQHRAKPIEICPAVFSRLLPSGAPDPSSAQRLSKKQPCRAVSWTGKESQRPKKRKLWALLIGFSQAPNDLVPPLLYAHDDAMDVARFLQLDSAGKLPGGKGYFDDVVIRLLVAAPEFPNADALSANAKIKTLQTELGDERFRMIYRQENERYHLLVRRAISETIEAMKVRRADDGVDWQDVILIYFSGHGFSKRVDGDRPYMQMGLITPDANRQLDDGVIWLDRDLIDELQKINYVSLVIIDACNSEITNTDSLDAERAQLKAYNRVHVDGRTELHFLLGSEVGKYAYEQSDYAVNDFVRDFALWPAAIAGKGTSVFSLGLLTSLVCQEAGEENAFTLITSKDFLKRLFFKESNSKWHQGMRPKLEEMMKNYSLDFVPPSPYYFGFPGGDGRNAGLRSVSGAPKCGFSPTSQ